MTSFRTRILVAVPLLACACGRPDELSAGFADLSNTQYGVDYACYRPSIATLKADGYKFVARYYSYVNSLTACKILYKDEADPLINAGLNIVGNYEFTGQEPFNGYGQGVSDATIAKDQAASAGEPTDRPVYFSLDAYTDQYTNWTEIDAYYDGVASVLGRSRTGAYGGYYTIRHLFDAAKIQWGWQTSAWSNGLWDSRAQLQQFAYNLWGGNADEDRSSIADFGQWGNYHTTPCSLDGHQYPDNTCTQTLQCNNGKWVSRSNDPSSCRVGIEPYGECLTDTGSIVSMNTCTSTLECDNGVWVSRSSDPFGCNCTLAGKSYAQNTCTETLQCSDGKWVARSTDNSGCDTGILPNGACVTDTGVVVPQNTCTKTLQCDDGVWVARSSDPSSCR
jgi:hypothetical protein